MSSVVVAVVVVTAVDLVEETISEEIDGPFYSQLQQQLYHNHKKVSRTVNYCTGQPCQSCSAPPSMAPTLMIYVLYSLEYRAIYVTQTLIVG